MQIPHDKHKQSVFIGKKLPKHTQFSQIWSNIKMSNNPAKYEVLIKQYLRSTLDISGDPRIVFIFYMYSAGHYRFCC